MKIKISELNPNPFKQDINGGELREDTIDKIRSNIKELGLMGSIPVTKRNEKYYLIAGHHRIEALKREYGNNFEVEVTIHNYSDDNMLRGMAIENLTQRSDELYEVTENLGAIRKYLQNKNGKVEVTNKEIFNWLDKSGKVMSADKMGEYLRVYDNLDKDLLRTATKAYGGITKKDSITISDATILSRLGKDIQKPMKEIYDKSGFSRIILSKLTTEFLTSSDEMKKKVLSEEVHINDLPTENLKIRIKKKIESDKKKNKGKIIITHYNQYLRAARAKIGKTNLEILQTCNYLNGLDKSGILCELDFKTMMNIIKSGTEMSNNYNKYLEKILNKFK